MLRHNPEDRPHVNTFRVLESKETRIFEPKTVNEEGKWEK
jgi:hypothetical protein